MSRLHTLSKLQTISRLHTIYKLHSMSRLHTVSRLHPILNPAAIRQHSSSSSTTSFFTQVLDSFPLERSLVFAYGSGVFRQEGHKDTRDNMTDFIFAVHDTEQWHKENMALHPSHYSTMARLMGVTAVKKCQEEWGARLYFNTLVPWGEGMIKYGVINKKHLLQDLRNWETLYVAGRLHKPVNIIEQEEDIEMKEALKNNLSCAVRAALLLLPEKFTEEELFLTVAGLSYTGDFRMVVGEDRNKVANIVRPQLDRFRELYRERLEEVAPVLHMSDSVFVQDMGSEGRMTHLTGLASGVRNEVLDMCTINQNTKLEEEMLEEIAKVDCSQMVSNALGKVVAGADKSQAAKGILTAGGRKAVIYSLAKVKKMVKSWN